MILEKNFITITYTILSEQKKKLIDKKSGLLIIKEIMETSVATQKPTLHVVAKTHKVLPHPVKSTSTSELVTPESSTSTSTTTTTLVPVSQQTPNFVQCNQCHELFTNNVLERTNGTCVKCSKSANVMSVVSQLPQPTPLKNLEFIHQAVMQAKPKAKKSDAEKQQCPGAGCSKSFKPEVFVKWGGVCYNCSRKKKPVEQTAGVVVNPVAKVENKVACPACNRPYLLKTITKYGGVCGRCSKKGQPTTNTSQLVPNGTGQQFPSQINSFQLPVVHQLQPAVNRPAVNQPSSDESQDEDEEGNDDDEGNTKKAPTLPNSNIRISNLAELTKMMNEKNPERALNLSVMPTISNGPTIPHLLGGSNNVTSNVATTATKTKNPTRPCPGTCGKSFTEATFKKNGGTCANCKAKS